MSEIQIHDEHKEDIEEFARNIKMYDDLDHAHQLYYTDALEMSKRLYTAQRTLVKLNLGTSDASMIRNAEILSHFINEARKNEEKSALYRDVVTALREALSLFIADKYEIDITQEWHLNVDQGILIYGEQSEPL
jgi:hypothetical protein